MTNYADRFGFMNAGNPPTRIPTKTHFLIGSAFGTYVAAFAYWKDFIFDATWTPVGILLSGLAIIASVKAVGHLGIGILQYFWSRYPKTFYSLSMIAFAVLMYAEWVADKEYVVTNGKHWPYFFLVMGILLVMEFILFKEWIKTVSEDESQK